MMVNPGRIAAIDLGTNSFHLVIVEFKDINSAATLEEIEGKKNFEILYRQREIVRINFGQGNKTNYLTPDGIQRAINTLKSFKEKINEFGAVTHAIATSAIREAENRDEFIQYVKENLGIEIQVISGFEEARLIYLGVLQGLNVYDKQILLIDIGGGSTELLIGKRGKILYTGSFKIGAVRLTQMFFDDGRVFTDERKLECIKYIKKELAPNIKPIRDIGFEQVIGTSGQIHTIARMLHLQDPKEKHKILHGIDFDAKQFKKISKMILSVQTLEELQNLPNLDEKRAEIIIPGTLILQVIMDELGIDKIAVSSFALREGIIIDALEKNFRLEKIEKDFTHKEEQLHEYRIQKVFELAKFYNVDLQHALQVRKIALKIFDELRILHQLNNYAKNLLEYSAILHDIGYYVSAIGHHKYSYFIIRNSNLVGFSDRELELIANIARYHRKALPDSNHSNFERLSENDKNLVRILSAILRLSDGLEKTHSALINDIKFIQKNSDNSYIMLLKYLTHPPEKEVGAAEKRKKILENLFNIKIELRLEQLKY